METIMTYSNFYCDIHIIINRKIDSKLYKGPTINRTKKV